jgi:probable rRNA maturation factor
VSPIPGRPARRSGPDSGEPTVFVADEQSDGPDTEADGAAIPPRGHPVDRERWSTLATQVLLASGVQGEAELSVLFVDEEHIAELNARHLGHEGPTDVLSFPIDGVPEVAAGLGPLRTIDDPDDQPLLLGDVVICPAVAARQAAGHAGSYEDEVALLLVHGVLHVLGMDHAEDGERVAMQARERELLSRFHGPLARDPWV